MTYFKKLATEFAEGTAKDKLGIVADLIQVAGAIVAIPFIKKLIKHPAVDIGISILSVIIMVVWFFFSLVMIWAIYGLYDLLKHPLTTTGMTIEDFRKWKNGSGKHKALSHINTVEALCNHLEVVSNYNDFKEFNLKLGWILIVFAIICFIIGIAPLIIFW